MSREGADLERDGGERVADPDSRTSGDSSGSGVRLLDRAALLAIIGLTVVTTVVFIYTVSLRDPWFGVYSGEHHDWLTGTTVTFAKNWINEGAGQIRFGMYFNPASPEFPTQMSRVPYISYPPGAVLPIYLISLISGREPSVAMVMGYNLVNHYLIALCLGLSAFFFLRRIGAGTTAACGFALIPILMELLLPLPLYYQQNSFFADQAVILPFALAVLLEVLRDGSTGKRRRVMSVAQGLVFLAGMFTEWLFVFVAVVFLVKRLMTGELRGRRMRELLTGPLAFAVGTVAGFALFLAQVTAMMWRDLGWVADRYLTKLMRRTALTEAEQGSLADRAQRIWGHIGQGYGQYGRALVLLMLLLAAAAAVWLFRARRRQPAVLGREERIAWLAFITVIPCALQILFFFNHSAVHNFSVLKLSVPFALVPFVLVPVLAAVLIGPRRGKDTGLTRAALIALGPALLIGGLYLAGIHRTYTDMFRDRNEEWYRVAAAVNGRVEPADIVFSPDIEVPERPPQLLSLTGKRVHRVEAAGDILDVLDGAGGDYRVVVILREEPPPGGFWDSLTAAADSVSAGGDAVHLYFSRASIQRTLAES